MPPKKKYIYIYIYTIIRIKNPKKGNKICDFFDVNEPNKEEPDKEIWFFGFELCYTKWLAIAKLGKLENFVGGFNVKEQDMENPEK